MAALFQKNIVLRIFAWEGGVGPGLDPEIRDPRINLHRIGFSKHLKKAPGDELFIYNPLPFPRTSLKLFPFTFFNVFFSLSYVKFNFESIRTGFDSSF